MLDNLEIYKRYILELLPVYPGDDSLELNKKNIQRLTSRQAYSVVYYNRNNKEIKQLERRFYNDAEFSFYYAKNILADRFPLGEKAIAKSPKFAYFYALVVLNKRWESAEDTISDEPLFAYLYAKDILKDKFPKHLHNKLIAKAIVSLEDHWIQDYLELVTG